MLLGVDEGVARRLLTGGSGLQSDIRSANRSHEDLLPDITSGYMHKSTFK